MFSAQQTKKARTYESEPLSAKANIPSGFPVNPRPQLFQRRFELFDQPIAIFPDPPDEVLGHDAAGDMLRAPAPQLQQRRDQAFL